MFLDDEMRQTYRQDDQKKGGRPSELEEGMKARSLPKDLVLLFFLLSSCLLRVFVLRAEGSMLFNESSSERGNHANEKIQEERCGKRRQGQGVKREFHLENRRKTWQKRFHCMEQRREPTKQTKEDESEL